MAQSETDGSTPPIERTRMIIDLIETPPFARVYAHIRNEGPVTVAELTEAIDIPQGTAYDYVRKLESAGLLTKTQEDRPYEYAATEVRLTLSSDDQVRTITAELIEAIARRDENGDLDVYIDRHGVDGLATAIEYAHEYVEGTGNHRIMARELDISPLEAEIILQALEPIVRANRGE